MATYLASVAQVENWEELDGLVSLSATTGSNRFIFGAAGAFHIFAGIPTINAFNYGGSGGTAMTALGASVTLDTAVGNIRGYYAVAGPTASTDLYADITTIDPQRVSIGGMQYSGVDQSTPYLDYTTTAPTTVSGVTTTTCSITIPNVVSGQTVIAAFTAYFSNSDALAWSAVSGTTLRASAIHTDAEPGFWGTAFVERVAGSSGSLTLEVTANQTTSGDISYAAVGMRLNDVSSGYTITAERGNYALNGQATGLQYPRTITSEQGSYALNGQDVTMVKSGSYSFTADYGMYTLVGSTALIDLSMNAEQGSYQLNGQDITLTFGALTNRTLTAEQGSYALNGQASNLLRGQRITFEFGTYSLTGYQAGLTWSGAPVSSGYITKPMSISAMRLGL